MSPGYPFNNTFHGTIQMCHHGIKLVFVLTFATGSLLMGADVEKEKKNEKEQASTETKAAVVTPAAKGVEKLRMAFQLADYGRENDLPEALILAAHVIGTTNMQKREAATPEGVDEYDPKKDAEALLAEALKLDAADEKTKSFADATRRQIDEATRGSAYGPVYSSGVVLPGNTAVFQIPFVIGQVATLQLRNVSGADLELVAVCNVGGGTLVDHRPGFDGFISFPVAPVSTGGFTVRIVNRSPFAANFVLITN